jgi:hypothetical protein
MITLLDDQSKLVSFVAYFDVQAMLINIAEDEGCLAHFGRESRDIRFNTIVNRDPSKELMVNRRCHKLCWDTLSFQRTLMCQVSLYSQTSDLCHNNNERHCPDVSALSTHIATSHNLETTLLSSIYIVRNIFRLLHFLLDWVPS